jgi:multidrug resistance efflux pump
VKTLIFLVVVCVAVGLFFHDKQQTADLTKANADNATLTQQVQTLTQNLQAYQNAVYQLKAQLATAQAAARGTTITQPISNYVSPLETGHVEGPRPDGSH